MNIYKPENELITEQGPLIEKYIHYNFKEVTAIELTEISISPMNIPTIHGYINNDEDNSFRATIYDGKFNQSLNFNNDELQKKNMQKNIKSIKEIEAEEAKNWSS